MAPFDCTKLHGYHCTFEAAKRGTQEEDERKAGVLIVTMFLVVCIFLFIAGLVARRIWKTPKNLKSNEVELAAVPQRGASELAVPAPVANPGRRGGISPAPPPYRVTSANHSKENRLRVKFENAALTK